MVPAGKGWPKSSTISATCPGTARPSDPGLTGIMLPFEANTRLHSVWPNISLIGTPSAPVDHSWSSLPTDSPPEMIVRKSIAVTLHRIGNLTHHPEHGRRQQCGPHPVTAHHGESLLGVEARRAKRQHWHSVEPGGHQHVHQPREPRPVGRRPHAVARLRKRIETHLGPRHVSEHRAVRLQRAFRVACCARGEIEECRIVGCGVDIFETVTRGFDRLGNGRRVRHRAIDQEDMLHRRRDKSGLLYRRQIGQVRDDDPHADGVEAIGDRVGREQVEVGTETSPAFQQATCAIAVQAFWPKQQHDPIAFDEAERQQKIGQLIGLPLHLAESHFPCLAVAVFADQRDLAGIAGVTVADVGGDVVARRDVPAERGI